MMSKKLVNEPERAVDEALAGMVAVHPGLRLLAGHRVVLRSDAGALAAEGKVTLLSGGGSGHEPAHAGFLGRGMLTAAVAGDLFASPPPSSILAALQAIRSPAGSLMIVKNYTGDRLNFGIALERARAEGMAVRMVVVGEDCALPSSDHAAGRRGLCGTVLVHKIAGAMAERGFSLEEVATTAQQVADNIGTMNVCLSPCSLPGRKPSFTLAEDEIELGLGIHGEAGAERIKVKPADVVVELMLKRITSQETGFQYFKAERGMAVGLIVNNLGGTSNLELSIVANSAIRFLVDKMGLCVERVYVGALMTSMEMAGVSLTLIKLLPQWTELLDQPTVAPGWPNVSVGVDGSQRRVDSSPVPSQASTGAGQPPATSLPEPTTIIGLKLRRCVGAVCEVLVEAEEHLNNLDRGGGDGDCGSTLKAGAIVIQRSMTSVCWDSPQQALLALAGSVERGMGGTSGAMYNLFLSAGAAGLGDPDSPLTWAQALADGMQAIMKRGGAKAGDRTMIDALSPAVEVLLQQLPSADNPLTTLQNAVDAAKAGTEATIPMRARAGRASKVHPSQLTQPDPGASAVAIWLEAILTVLSSE